MPANNTPETHTFWEFKKYNEAEWFKSLVILLLILAGIYLVIHYIVDKHCTPKKNYEYAKLDDTQKLLISKFYLDSSLYKNRNNLDSVHQKALLYISNEFSNNLDSIQLDSIRKFLKLTSPIEATAFLANERFKVVSNFWLIGPCIYWEIIFWSWFGVISSILFNLGMVGKSSTTVPGDPLTQFDSSEIPYQIAKLLYAPLCTLVVVFGYNYFRENSIADISSSKGVIVFAFIGGFYSARLVAFLDRLKEVLLPHAGTVNNNSTTSPDAQLLESISIELSVNNSSLSPDMLNDIAETGLGTAVVNLENVETGKKFTAEKTGDDQSGSFVVHKITAGKYKISATWTNEIDGEPVTLHAEQTETLSTTGATISMSLNQSDDEG